MFPGGAAALRRTIAMMDSDLAIATRAATDIELRFGFGSLGAIHFDNRAALAMMFDCTVLGGIRTRLADCYGRARELVASNRETIKAIACRLNETRARPKSRG